MGVVAGPFDLAVSMGLAGDHRAPAVQAALRRLIHAAAACNLPLVMPVFAPERDALQQQLNHWRALGITRFAVGADKIIVSHALASYRGWAAG